MVRSSSMVSIVMTALVCSGCADVVSNGGGSGGSSGAGGTSVGCNLDNREPNDLFDDKTGIGSGTRKNCVAPTASSLVVTRMAVSCITPARACPLHKFLPLG